MTKQQYLVLVVSILASLVAFLDGSVVNVALPAIVAELGGGLSVQQWVVDAYLITLGSLILLAGSLSDLFGRKKILTFGLIGFGVTSLLCAFAPTSSFLIGARALQGVAGALLVPSSLALIIASFSGASQGKAIGTWTAWTGVAFIIGPLIGGYFVDTLSWRWVFAINLVPILITLWLMRSLEKGEQSRDVPVDWLGALVCTIGLAATVYALIEQSHLGWSSPLIYGSFGLGIILLGLFVWHESQTKHPMMPLELFRVRNFAVGNVATTAIYAALSVATFLLVVFVQQVGHYTALSAGMALLPVTIIMFLLSPYAGSLAGKFGPRWFMALGPIIGAIGFLLMRGVDASVSYWTQLFPGIVVFGIGLAITVAPLTAAILSDIDQAHAGIGSAVNNAIARIAGLVATATIGIIAGTELTVAGFHNGLLVTAILLVLGGIISAIGIQNRVATSKQS